MPLQGFPIPAATGNVRVVIDPLQHTVAIQVPVPVRVKPLLQRRKSVVIGLGSGGTEVFADSRGNFYGEGFGRVLDRLSTQTTTHGAERNRLHAAEKKLAASTRPEEREKAARLRRLNRGRMKLDARRIRGQVSSRGEALDFRSHAGDPPFPARCAGHGGSQSDARSDQEPAPLTRGLALDAVKSEGTSGVPVPSGRFPVGDRERRLYLSGVSAVRLHPPG
jgi:hypothetical protein